MLKGYDADICIIGSGIAGALVAHACAARGASVVMLEAGPRFDRAARPGQLQRFLLGYDPWPADQTRDVFVNSSAFKYSLNDYRLRAVGGSTLRWSAVAQRLFASDFETHTRYGLGVDWPISYDDLEPYYAAAEEQLGVSGDVSPDVPRRSGPFPMPAFPDAFGDALWRRATEHVGVSTHRMSFARNNHISYDGRPPCATYASCTICPVGAQYSADWHVMKAERTGRCVVLPETPARRIETDSEGNVTVVRASKWGGGDVDVRARRYVVAAHAIETARLMLMSKVGNSDHLGHNFMEHWEITGRGLSTERNYPMRVGFPTLASNHFYDGPDRNARGAIRVVFRDNINPHDRFGSRPGLWGAGMADHDCETFGHWRGIEIGTEHQPSRDSRVTLDTSVKDPFGDPAPNFRFALSAVDERTQADGRQVMRDLFAAAGLTDVTVNPRAGGAHHMGTCRMSARGADGVVDSHLRVHGMANLYVAGSAVFPTGGAVTPTLTIAALSLRLAEQLMRTLRS